MSEAPTEAKLVEINELISNIRLEIRYATTNNFTGQVIYPTPHAFLIEPAAKALIEANTDFNKKGFGILVWDAYRPLSVTQVFWDATPDHLHNFVADPAIGSVHNRGCAIDMTLYDLSSHELLEMPTEFDDFTDKARLAHVPSKPEVLENRTELVETMKKHGFSVHPNEWWHYNFDGYEKYPVLDIPFEKLA